MLEIKKFVEPANLLNEAKEFLYKNIEKLELVVGHREDRERKKQLYWK